MAKGLTNVDGGVIGNFTPIETIVDVVADEVAAVGTHALGIKVPAGKFVYGVYVKNLANDLASGGSATVDVKVGNTSELGATAIATVKGAGKAKIVEEPLFVATAQDVNLTVATAALTAGKLLVGVIYG